MSESNNNTPMRITQLEEATNYEDGMYYAVAKAGSGTKKIKSSIITKNISDNIELRLKQIDGLIVPFLELGAIAFSSASIAYQTSTAAVRTPEGNAIRVKVGDIIKLTDYNSCTFKVAILRDSDSKYTYSSYLTEDYRVTVDGVAYIVVKYSNDSTVTDIMNLSTLVRFDIHVGNSEQTLLLNNHDEIIENEKFINEIFGNGEFGEGYYLPNSRRYRVSTIRAFSLNYNIYLKAKTGFRFYTLEYNNGSWVYSGWVTSKEVVKNTLFGLTIARTTEDSSEIANIETFLSNILTSSELTKSIEDIKSEINVDVNASKIETYMSRFYDSDEVEAFTFFTDPHLMGDNGTFSKSNFRNYINTLKATHDETSSLYVVCGGDWLNSGDTKDEASYKLGFVNGQMIKYFGENYYPIVGNHDFNYLGVDGEGNRLPWADWVPNQSMANFWFERFGKCYYKFKRHISMNYILDTRQDYDGTNPYDEEMLDWFAANLIEDDPEHSTIMFHIYYLSAVGTSKPTRIKAIGKIIEAFNNHNICTLTEETEEYSKTYDFTGTTGHIDFVLVGHSHADFSDTLGGVPVIGCINFTKNNEASFDLVLADYTNNKLFLTRIGYGSDRDFTI